MTNPLDDILGAPDATPNQAVAKQQAKARELLTRFAKADKKDSEGALSDLIAAVRHDPSTFCEVAYQWGQGELATSKGLRVWQKDITDTIGKHLSDPATRFTPLKIAVSSGHGPGKSSLVSMLIDWALSTCVDTKIVVTANTENQLRTKTWPEVIKWVRGSINAHWFDTTATAVMAKDPTRASTWRADAIPWSENNTEAFAGLHNEGKRLVLIFDEASSIVDKVWEVAEGAMTDANTEIIWLAFGNPTQNTGRFRECFGKFKHRWITRQIDSRTVEGTNKAQMQTWVDDYGEDSDFVRVRVRGEFPRSGNLQFISSEVVAAAAERTPEAYPRDVRVMGVDVSRFGGDESVICYRQGRDAASTPWGIYRGLDTMSLADRVMEGAERFKPDAIFIDGGGVGGGVIDRLRMLRLPVIEVQFGAKADRSQDTLSGPVHYANKSAEMWGYMKDWLVGGSIPDDPDLVEQLCGRQYGYIFRDGRDVIMLEKKADMAKRGLQSPDRADALCFVGDTLVKTPKGDRRIDSLRVGEEVCTPFGNTRIAKTWVSVTDNLTEAVFSNDSLLIGKGAHKVFVWGEGEKRLDALTLTDVVSVYKKQELLWQMMKFITKAFNIQFRPLVDTIRAEKSVTVRAFFTVMCGQIITDLSQKILTYTTKTIIGGTTTSPTLRQSISPYIAGRTLPPYANPEYSNPQAFWQESELRNGTEVRKALSGIDSTQKVTGIRPSLKQSNALCAQKTTRLSWEILNTAPVHVCRKLISARISRMSGIALGAVKSLKRIGTGRRNVVPVSVVTRNAAMTNVFNLTLEKHNAYYANEILVYNCLTFAFPVVPTDHTQELRNGNMGFQPSSAPYNPFSREIARGIKR